jgi:hypothetical protein
VYFPLPSAANAITSERITSSTEENPGPASTGKRHREHPRAVMIPRLLQNRIEIRALAVELIDHQKRGMSYSAAAAQTSSAPGFHAIHAADHDHRRVRHAQRAERLADEIRRPRAVDDVQLAAQPFLGQHRGVDRLVVLLLVRMEIRDRVALLDRPRAADFSGAHQHRLTEQRLSGRGVAGDSKVADVGSAEVFHNELGLFRMEDRIDPLTLEIARAPPSITAVTPQIQARISAESGDSGGLKSAVQFFGECDDSVIFRGSRWGNPGTVSPLPMMELFLIDAIGPFFRGYERKRVNWSKIPFMHLAGAGEDDWAAIGGELRRFAGGVSAQGYNAVTLDDLAHLTHHPLHEPEVAERIAVLREKFAGYFDMLRDDFGLKVYLTTDVLPMTPAIAAAMGDDPVVLSGYYRDLVCQALDDFPQLSGLILRIGESDGNDVNDPIRTRLHLRSAKETNRLLRDLLPEFEKRGRDLIFRTWTVGAHRIGDLIWHRGTLEKTLAGLESERLIVSMKHGESDFFRYLPLNRAFFRVKQRKIIELQARREYEGAGEYPSFIGWDCARFAEELSKAENVIGMSVWCQTGGWHRFRRRAFLEADGRDIWIRLNTAAAIGVFRNGEAPERAVEKLAGAGAVELLELSETVIRDLLYIGDFARQKLYFRRVRIPPLLHVYWDSLFINHGVRKAMRHFVGDPADALAAGEGAAPLFPRMIEVAGNAGLPVEDIEHMRDFFHLLLLARRYYFMPFSDEVREEITAAKKAYKRNWPKEGRHRYRVKVSFEPFPIRRRSLALAARVLLRRQRGYRLVDRLFVLYLSGVAYRALRPRDPAAMPKFFRKSAMGVDVLFK